MMVVHMNCIMVVHMHAYTWQINSQAITITLGNRHTNTIQINLRHALPVKRCEQEKCVVSRARKNVTTGVAWTSS